MLFGLRSGQSARFSAKNPERQTSLVDSSDICSVECLRVLSDLFTYRTNLDRDL